MNIRKIKVLVAKAVLAVAISGIWAFFVTMMFMSMGWRWSIGYLAACGVISWAFHV